MNHDFIVTTTVEQINVDAFKLGMPYHLYRTIEYKTSGLGYSEYIGILTGLSKNHLEFTMVNYTPTYDETKNGECDVKMRTLTVSDLHDWEIDLAEFPIPSHGVMQHLHQQEQSDQK